MLKSQAVAQYLPFLRRYARALTGNQASGDAYVGATLEALIEDPKVIDDTGGPRVALYRLFTRIWNSVGVNAEGRAGYRRYAGRRPAREPDAQAAPGLPAGRPGGLLRRGRRQDPGRGRLGAARAGRRIRPRACGRDRNRRADHRGRDLYRDGSRIAGRKPRSSRAGRRAHPQGSDGARAEKDPRADPRRHPAGRRQLRAGCGERAAQGRSRCR